MIFLEKLEAFLYEIWTIYISWNNNEYVDFFKMIFWKVSVADSSVVFDSLKYDCEILSFYKEMLKIKASLT